MVEPHDDAANTSPEDAAVPSAVILLLSLACGIVVANIYYVQPLVGLIGRSYGMPVTGSGLLVTVTQLGYAAGLILMVPLGDAVENRRLILSMLGVLVVALAVTFEAPTAGAFLGASIVIGLTASAVQIMVPFAGHLATDATRGRVVGNVVSGLLIGIMLARPISSFSAHLFGTRSIFGFSAVAIVLLSVMLAAWLPRRQPDGMAYWRALASLGPLLATTPALHRRGFYQATLFSAFSLFWTAVPLLLEGPAFHFSQVGIGIFALVGAGGAIASPIAGRAADAGHDQLITGASLIGAAAAVLVALLGGVLVSWPILVVAAVLLDMAVAAHLVTGQREIFQIGPATRGRLNGLYLALFFAGGALGSLAAGIAFAHGGWPGTCIVGTAFPLIGLAYFLIEQTRAAAANAI